MSDFLSFAIFLQILMHANDIFHQDCSPDDTNIYLMLYQLRNNQVILYVACKKRREMGKKKSKAMLFQAL